MILFPEVTISALSLIFNINDGILRILIGRAMLGPCIQIGKISASARIGAQKHQHQLGLELKNIIISISSARSSKISLSASARLGAQKYHYQHQLG